MHETVAGMHTNVLLSQRRRAASPPARRHNPASSLCAGGNPQRALRTQNTAPPAGGEATLFTSGPRGGLTQPPRGLPAFNRKNFVAGGRAVAPAGRWNASARSVLRDSRYPIHRALLKSSGTRLPRTRSTEGTEGTEHCSRAVAHRRVYSFTASGGRGDGSQARCHPAAAPEEDGRVTAEDAEKEEGRRRKAEG